MLYTRWWETCWGGIVKTLWHSGECKLWVCKCECKLVPAWGVQGDGTETIGLVQHTERCYSYHDIMVLRHHRSKPGGYFIQLTVTDSQSPCLAIWFCDRTHWSIADALGLNQDTLVFQWCYGILKPLLSSLGISVLPLRFCFWSHHLDFVTGLPTF